MDSKFDTDLDGCDIVAFLQRHLPEIPIVVCSVLYDKKPHWLRKKYEHALGVRAIIGKAPFPKGADLVRMCTE